MKIYTKKGDDGNTALFGGGRVPKHDPVIEACGTVDEINSLLGNALAESPTPPVGETLRQLQHQLFILGADIATPPEAKNRIDRIGDRHIHRLEEMIDQANQELPPLKHFILPGGNPSAATLHLARSVCRRAERAVSAAREQEILSAEILIYLNRLSDLLFVLARYENLNTGTEETLWKPQDNL
ncbi:MAG: cob(I)yrinic acid a,c-diamide adenosyltransferase [Balneolaceae bacterium]